MAGGAARKIGGKQLKGAAALKLAGGAAQKSQKNSHKGGAVKKFKGGAAHFLLDLAEKWVKSTAFPENRWDTF